MANKDTSQDREQYESKLQQMEFSKQRIIESSSKQMETLREFIKYLADINQSQLSVSTIPEIWDCMNKSLVLANKCNFYSLLNDDGKEERKYQSLSSMNIDALKKEIKRVSDSQFELIQKTKKEIRLMKNKVRELLKRVLKIVTKENTKYDSLKNQMLYYSPMFHRKRARKPIRCLVIDGGGLRGCLSIKILQALETKAREQSKDENKKLCDLFDLIIGTSTGGLIALGVGMNKWNTEKIDKFYNKVAVDVFGAIADEIKNPPTPNKMWDKTKEYAWMGVNSWNYFRKETAKYNEEKLIKCVTDEESKGGAGFDENQLMFDKKQGTINKPFVALVAVENSIPKQSYPLLLRNYDPTSNGYIDFEKNKTVPRLPGISNIKVWEAARATSAAPSYFRSISVTISGKNGGLEEKEKDFRLVDGGLNANTPTLLAWIEASKLWPDREIFIYSVGTGRPEMNDTDKLKNTNAGLVNIKDMAFASLWSGQAATQLFSLRVMASMDKLDLFHSWPEIDKDKEAMDEWRYMQYWRETAEEYLKGKEKKAKLDQMVSFLLKHQNYEHEEDIFKQAYMNGA